MSQLENSTTTRITEKLHPGGSVEAAGMSLESDYNSNQLSNEAGGLHTNGRTARGGNLASSSCTYTSPSYSAASPLSTQDHLAASEGDTRGSEELGQELGRKVRRKHRRKTGQEIGRIVGQRMGQTWLEERVY